MDFRNIGELLAARASESPGKKFLFSESDGREWTYEGFDRVVHRAANMFISCGIGKGDVVSLLLPNSPEYVAAYFACWKIGAVAGPVNSLLKREEIEWVVTNSESKLLLIGTGFLSEPPLASGGSPQAPEVIIEGPSYAFGIPCLSFDNLDAALEKCSGEIAPAPLTPDDEAIIIYTSGTTGKPKGCLLTHGNLLANAQQITEWLGFGPDDRLLTVMPLFHMNAVTVTTMTALYCGGSTVVLPKFSASRFWDIIVEYQITSFGSVATMLSMLLERRHLLGGEPARSRRSVRFAMCGSAPVPAEVLKRFEETFGILVIEGYGLSESTCRSTFNPPNENRRPGSCGKPIGNEMKIFDEEDREVPDGELGEIALRGPNIFKGYFKNPDATAKAFANGWFHTGDIAYRDADGFFYIADRKSDMIIRGGENIYPREIDDLLYTHPAVAAAAVIGVPDQLYGEEVAAFIVLKDHETATQVEIIDFCKQGLADYKCPKTVHFVGDIPKGPTGKLLKRELAKLFSEAPTQ
jgi:long-chain acyl-CoA synthetase